MDQIGSDLIEVRVGGLYALGGIARDSQRGATRVAEMLSAYVRVHASWPPRRTADRGVSRTVPAAFVVMTSGEDTRPATARRAPLPAEAETPTAPADIQAAMLTLARDASSADRLAVVDLSETDLRGVVLTGADMYLRHASLVKVHLEHATLDGMHLDNAVLDDAHLEHAHLVGATFEAAQMIGVHLDSAWLGSADLGGAQLVRAHLERAQLPEARLNGAFLIEARLDGAVCTGADFDGAWLMGAHLENARLTGAKNLATDSWLAVNGMQPIRCAF